MTLSATPVRLQYNGDDSTVSFPITFIFWLEADISVIHTDALGVDTPWINGTHYLLTGGEGLVGSVEVEISPTDYTPATGEVLTVASDVAFSQTTALPLGGRFPSISVEERLDKNVRLSQQLNDTFARAITLKTTSPFTDLNIADPVSGEILIWEADNSIGSTLASTVGAAVGVDETDTDATKDKLLSNLLAKQWEAVRTTAAIGPASSTDNAIARFDSTTGLLLQDSVNSTINDQSHLKLAGTNAALDMAERATGPSFQAGRGHIWMKDDVPTTFWFTDDVGTDVQLGIALGGDVVGPASSTDNAIARFDTTTGVLLQDSVNSTINDNSHFKLIGSNAAIDMVERATGPSFQAGRGHFWVKNDVPSTAWFTDDAGTETQLGAAGGGGIADYTDLIVLVAAPDADWIFNESAGDYNWRVESVNSTHMLYIDAATDRVSISDADIAGTDGLLHIIQTGSPGTHTASSLADTIVLESSTHLGITFITSDAGHTGTINWDNPAEGVAAGQIKYDAFNNRMAFTADGDSILYLEDSGTTFNPTNLDKDFIVRSDNNTQCLYLDGGTNTVSHGAGAADTALAEIGGMLNIDTGTDDTTAVTTEEILKTYTLPSNAVFTNGRGVRIRAWGTTAANANTKQIKVKFGAGILVDTGAVAANAKTWDFTCEVYRTGGATQDAITLIYSFDGTVVEQTVTTPTETLGLGIAIVVTGQNGTANAADIRSEGFTVQYI